jgi:DNA-binding PadR family transcriptional regulator
MHRRFTERHSPDGEGRRHRHHPAPGGRGFGEHGHGEHGRRGGHRGRGRAQRGDVRAAILLLLADEPMHGYQLMHAIADRTEGAWRPSPGAIYPTIAQLEDEGLVITTADSGRKLVTLTEAGRTHLAEKADTMTDPFTEITAQAGGTNDLRGAIEQLHVAARAVAQTGNSAQIAATAEVLSQARRSLYLILAEAPTDAS